MRQLKISTSITKRDSASLDKYLQEISREPRITVDEEVELAQRITRECVRQIKEKALRGLRKPSRSAVLRGYL